MQTRLQSLTEVTVSTVLGAGIGWYANMAVGLSPKTSFWLTVVLTAVSFIRSFIVRRVFNWWSTR